MPCQLGPGLLVQLQPLECLHVILPGHPQGEVVGGLLPHLLVVGQLGHHLLQPAALKLIELVVLLQDPGEGSVCELGRSREGSSVVLELCVCACGVRSVSGEGSAREDTGECACEAYGFVHLLLCFVKSMIELYYFYVHGK